MHQSAPEGWTIWPALIAAALVISAPAEAAIIGPTDDRIPLQDALKPCPKDPSDHLACGLTRQQIDTILDAGMRVTCKGKEGGMLNAWLLEEHRGYGDWVDSKRIYTNAHAVIDGKSGTVASLDCSVSPMRSIWSHHRMEIPVDVHDILVGKYEGHHRSRDDRARMGVIGGTSFGKLLPFDAAAAYQVEEGDRIYNVSLKPPGMMDLIIQACVVKRVSPPNSGPGLLETDCESVDGMSGSIFLLPKSNGPTTSLQPIALLTASVEKVGDNQPWDFNRNSTIGIILDSSFNQDLVPLTATPGTKLFDPADNVFVRPGSTKAASQGQ